ncbi:trypsin-like cysteine/serine peptidase domain-containing protein [Gorgonomyces haynaldii]|nr:trypsin-like cysteine/serine peptidase domain-containing protein [Gorgonomyces haynaldii]
MHRNSIMSLFLNALLASATPAPKEDPVNIVGGTVATAYKYPWLVSLQSGGSHFCGGILLNPTTVLTAGHCSDWGSVSGLTAKAHRQDLRKTSSAEGGSEYKVTSIKVHPSYRSAEKGYDVAIWKVKLTSGPGVTGYNFYFDDGSKTAAGTSLTIAGWGTTSSNGAASKVLLTATVPVTTAARCSKAYPGVASTSFCAGYTNGGVDTCQGDSGGPIFVQSGTSVTLAGTVSYGQGCASAAYPGVYSRLSSASLQSFITANL